MDMDEVEIFDRAKFKVLNNIGEINRKGLKF